MPGGSDHLASQHHLSILDDLETLLSNTGDLESRE